MRLNKWKPSRAIDYVLYRDLNKKRHIVSKKNDIYEYIEETGKYNKISIREKGICLLYSTQHYSNRYIRCNNTFKSLNESYNISNNKIIFVTDDTIEYVGEKKVHLINKGYKGYSLCDSYYFAEIRNPYMYMNAKLFMSKIDVHMQMILFYDDSSDKLFKIRIKTIQSNIGDRYAIMATLRQCRISLVSIDETINSEIINRFKNKINEIEGIEIIDICEYK